LWKLPVNSFLCNVSNSLNTKLSFAKSSGTYCKKKKIKKNKKKLILLDLPSKKEILLPKNTKVYVGKNNNFKVNELTEGKWGNSFSLKKKINVRGVAMNPVDHPNGGRAKSVQPERSPWNWVAKKKK
jgi:large subunit ribosomal protein L2